MGLRTVGKAAAIPLIVVAGVSCARMEVAEFQAGLGQQTMVRDGVPVILSRQQQSLVLLRPAARQFKSNRRPVYVLALYNLSHAPLQFMVANVHVAQAQPDGQLIGLKVYTYDELVSEERTRQAIQAVAVGLAAAGNSMSAASAGNYNGTAIVNGPRGTAVVNVHGYDPSAAAIAQNNAAAQNEAMIDAAVETGQRNLATLERSVIKDDTLLPGEWYGGQLQFDPPSGSDRKDYVITVQIGNDTHQINVVQTRPGHA
jgi:hypothetical protein